MVIVKPERVGSVSVDTGGDGIVSAQMPGNCLDYRNQTKLLRTRTRPPTARACCSNINCLPLAVCVH